MGVLQLRTRAICGAVPDGQGRFRKHTVNRFFDNAFRVCRHYSRVRHMALMAHVTGIQKIRLLLGFPTGDLDFVRVDHDDKIAGIHVRSVHGLVLATNHSRDFGGKTAQYHAFCIDNEPLAVDVFRSRAIGLHTSIFRAS